MSSYLRKFQFSSKLSFSSAGESSDKEVGEDEDEVLDHHYDSNNDEIERSKIKIIFMRAHVEKEDPSSKDVDDFMIKRFLRARNLDIEKASALFLKYLSWRRDFVPNGSISPSEIQIDISHKKMFMQGQDKLGRPIVVVFGECHKQGSLEEFKRFVTFSLDKICSRIKWTGGEVYQH